MFHFNFVYSWCRLLVWLLFSNLISDLLRLAESLGAKSFRVQPFFPAGRGMAHREKLDLIPETTRYVSKFSWKQRRNHQ